MARDVNPDQLTSTRSLRVNGVERRYILLKPRAASSGLPAVIELHGRGIDPVMFDRWTGYGQLSASEGFVLALPYAVDEIWNDGRALGASGVDVPDDIGFLVALIDELIAMDGVAPERVYLVGMSNGAAMAGRMAWQAPERIAAIAQVAGTATADLTLLPSTDLPMPIIHIHGTADRVNPYDGGRATFLLRMFMRGHVGPSLSVDDWAQIWIQRNRVDPEARIERIGDDVTVRSWHGNTPASDLFFYRVERAGHTWPGIRVWSPPHLGRVSRTIDATRLTWEFLSRHSR